MTPSEPRYEAVYIDSPANDDDDVALAVAWARDRARQFGCGFTVIAPSRDSFRLVSALESLPKGVSKETWRTMRTGHVEPVIVACWPDERTLAHLDSRPRLKALCVLRWTEKESEPWRIARGAVNLWESEPAAPPEPEISDPVVLAAMQSLTRRVNLNTGIIHPDDRDAAINTFRLLQRARYRFEPDEIKTWATANGWRAQDAIKLAEVARGVLSGHAYRTRSKASWVPNILDLWRADAQKSGES
jgi:hypothetical protein